MKKRIPVLAVAITSLVLLPANGKAAIINLADASLTGDDTVVRNVSDIVGQSSIYIAGTMTFNAVDTTQSVVLTEVQIAGASNAYRIGQATNTDDFNLIKPATAVLDDTLVVGDSHSVVIKMDTLTGAYSVWLDPNLGLPEASTVADVTNPGGPTGTLEQVQFRTNGSANADFSGFALYTGADTPFGATPAPAIASFSGSPARISAGASTTLSWNVTNAASVTITPDVGDVTSLTTNGAGSVVVSPADTVKYTLTATNPEGSAVSTSGVRVIGGNADKRPNIILFYVDDMGWQDTSLNFHTSETIYNRRYITPNMETLASSGVKFTNAYSAATICQPSRYALMSGLRPVTSGYTYNGAGSTTATIAPPAFAPAPIDTVSTIPKSLKSLGYETIQMGKWHIKGTNSDYSQNILASGYDRKIAANDAGQPGSYQGTSNFGTPGMANHVPDLEAYHGQDVFLTEAMTLEANKAIEESMAKGKPFFLFLSHYAIHTPIQRDSRFTAHYDDAGDGDHYISNSTERSYATMIEGMDKSLGDLMTKLSALGIAEDTLVVFSSDHGGLTFTSRGPSAYPDGTFPPTGIAVSNQSHNYPLRYGKGWTYEGGIRVPMIVSWASPNSSNPIQSSYPVRSSATEDRFVNQIDLFPTLVKAAGGLPPETIHGFDMSHYLSGNPGNDRPAKYVWHQPHWRPDHNIPHVTAMRYGKWKIVHQIESATWELYDLSTDIHENNNLANSHPREMALYGREMIRELETAGAQYATWVRSGREIRPIPLVLPGTDADYDGVDDVEEDPNGNGIVDIGETDPNLFDHFSELDSKITLQTGSRFAISYVRQNGASQHLEFQLQSSTDLSGWIDVDLSGQISDNGNSTETVTWSFDHPGLAALFYRLHITHLDLILP